MRDPEDELATIETVRANLLSAQSAARRAFDLCQRIEILVGNRKAAEGPKHGVAERVCSVGLRAYVRRSL